MRRAAIILAILVGAGLPATAMAGEEPGNPLIGAWSRESAPGQDWQDGDPRQQLTFTPDKMIVGIGDGVDLRRYDIGQSTVRAETRKGLIYRFRIVGPDRMCMVPQATDPFAPVAAEPRCYVRRHVVLDRSLV